MVSVRSRRTLRAIPFLIVVCLLGLPVYAKYSGGTGEPNDPYQIATAADLIALGETPEDYDKHFILTADIDLDPNLPGRKVFDRAVIAPDVDPVELPFRGAPFMGVFNGSGHTISHATVEGDSFLGLFGQLASGAEIKDLGVVDVKVAGLGPAVGGLAGSNLGTLNRCYTTGAVSGRDDVGGLAGLNGDPWSEASGSVKRSYSAVAVGATDKYGSAGGLVGWNYCGTVTESYATGTVCAKSLVGGLVGVNRGSVRRCYSTGAVCGGLDVGGLVGWNYGSVLHSVWDVETSGLAVSAGGVGLTTAEMLQGRMLGLNGFANDPNWVLDEGRDYPRLVWQGTPGGAITEPTIDWLEGKGTAEEPYRIDTAAQLISLGRASLLCDRHLVLGADIDMDPNLTRVPIFRQALIPSFGGILDGDGHTISHLTISGMGPLGLLGQVESGAEVRNLGLVRSSTTGSNEIGALAGRNCSTVTHCYSTGVTRGTGHFGTVGGLIGGNWGNVSQCYSSGVVSGTEWGTGGLVGGNYASVSQSHSDSMVSGDSAVGGLVGEQDGFLIIGISQCYSTGNVRGNSSVGGLVGFLYVNNFVTGCYSAASVSGKEKLGGLVGSTGPEEGPFLAGGIPRVVANFWDTEASGQTKSQRGTGKTTAEMQTAKTFLDAGWDFVGETVNGTDDIWKIAEGLDYPRLWWEPYDGRVTVVLGQVFTVTLESNPSTGYRWEWVDDQDSIVEQMGQAQFKPRETGDPPLVGAGGWESFDFKAVHQGQMTRKLVYRRPWEEGVEPLKTFSLQVAVP